MNIYVRIAAFVIIYVLESIPLYFLFDKAGEKSYKGLIPIVRYHTLFKIVWHSAYFYPYIVLSVALKVLNYFLDTLFSYDDMSIALILFSLVSLAVGIVYVILFVFLQIKTAKAFSRSKGFIAGLILLHTLFLYILTFSKKSIYIGPQDSENDNAENDTDRS